MNIKKIWILSIIFGLITTVVFYYNQKTQSVRTEEVGSSVEVEEAVSGEELQASENELVENEEEVQEVEMLGIAKGKRAVSIAADTVQGVSGFLNPGDFVDVALVYPPVPQHEDPFVVLLFENIKVLATGERRVITNEVGHVPYGTVTLELSAIDGAKLSLAAEKGRIVLMLRGQGDSSISDTKHLDEQSLH